MSDLNVERYGGGFIVADYTGKRGKFGAAYAGADKQWRDQPVRIPPFSTKAAVEAFLKELAEADPDLHAECK